MSRTPRFESHPPPHKITQGRSHEFINSRKVVRSDGRLSIVSHRPKDPSDPNKSGPSRLGRIERDEAGNAIRFFRGPPRSSTSKGSVRSTRSGGPSMAPVPEDAGPEPLQDGEATDIEEGDVDRGDDDGKEEADEIEGEADVEAPLPGEPPAHVGAEGSAGSRAPSKVPSKVLSLKAPSRTASQRPSRPSSNHPSRVPSKAPSSRLKDDPSAAPEQSQSKGSRMPSRHSSRLPEEEMMAGEEVRVPSNHRSKTRSTHSGQREAFEYPNGEQFTEYDPTQGTGEELFRQPDDPFFSENGPPEGPDGGGFVSVMDPAGEQGVPTTVKKPKEKKRKGTKKAKKETSDPPPEVRPQRKKTDYDGVEVSYSDDESKRVEREVERTNWEPTSHGRDGERSADKATGGSRRAGYIVPSSRQSSVQSENRSGGQYDEHPPTPEYMEGPPQGLSQHSKRSHRPSDPRSSSARPPDIHLTAPSPSGSENRQQSLAPDPYEDESGTGNFEHSAARNVSTHSRVSFAAEPRADSGQEPQHRAHGASTSSRHRKLVPGSFPEPEPHVRAPSAPVHPANARRVSTPRHNTTEGPDNQEEDYARSTSRHSGYSQTQLRDGRQHPSRHPPQHDARWDDGRSEAGTDSRGGWDGGEGEYQRPSQSAHNGGSRHPSTAPGPSGHTESEIIRGFRHVTHPPTAGERIPSHAASERVPSQQPPDLSSHPRSALAATHGKGDSFVNWRMYYKENPNGGHEDRGPAQSGRAPSRGYHSSDHNDEYYDRVRSGSRYSSNTHGVPGEPCEEEPSYRPRHVSTKGSRDHRT